jgi:hypothetical protein
MLKGDGFFANHDEERQINADPDPEDFLLL